MIGIVLVTHENIGAELLKAVDGIVGPQKQTAAVSVGLHDGIDSCRDRIAAALKAADSGKGVIMFVDLCGGTPSNLAIASMPAENALILTGVNLPMLIKLAALRDTMNLLDAAQAAEAAGHKYIKLVSESIAPRAPWFNKIVPSAPAP